jgi:hypothetical protein
MTHIINGQNLYNKEPKRVFNVKHNQSKSIIFLLLSFETIIIMTSESFFPHMNVKELKVKIHLIKFEVLVFI